MGSILPLVEHQHQTLVVELEKKGEISPEDLQKIKNVLDNYKTVVYDLITSQ